MLEESDTEGGSTERPGSYTIPRIGVDAKSRTHYYHDEKSRVLVYDSKGEIVHTEDLNGRTLKDWTEYISASVGWEQAPGHWVDVLVNALAAEEPEGGAR